MSNIEPRTPREALRAVDQAACDMMGKRLERVAHGPSAFTKHLAILETLSGDLRGKTVLDVGCGEGHLMAEAYSLGMNPTGIDIYVGQAESRAQAEEYLVSRGMRRDEATARIHEHDISEPLKGPLAARFDFAISVGMLEHIPSREDRAAAVRNMFSALAPGGTLILVCAPNRWFPVDLVHYGPRFPFYHWLPEWLKRPYMCHLIEPHYRTTSRPLNRVQSAPSFLNGVRVSEIIAALRQADPDVQVVRGFPTFARLSVHRQWIRKPLAQLAIRVASTAAIVLRIEPIISVIAQRRS